MDKKLNVLVFIQNEDEYDDEDEDEKLEKKEQKFKFAGSDKGMDGEERRQHNFHDQLAHKTMHNFHGKLWMHKRQDLL